MRESHALIDRRSDKQVVEMGRGSGHEVNKKRMSQPAVPEQLARTARDAQPAEDSFINGFHCESSHHDAL